MNSDEIMEGIEALKTKDITYIDAAVEFAQNNNIEIELLADIIRRTVTLKAKIRKDAESLNIVEKTRTLPI